MSEDRYAPFVLGTFEDNHEVLLYDFEEFTELFEEYGFSGNGHSWGSLVRFILETEDPALLEEIELDPEGDTFVAIARSQEKQVKLAELLSKIATDRSRLEHYLDTVPVDDMDD